MEKIKKLYNFPFMMGLVWITLNIGIAIGNIGQETEASLITWSIPLSLFIFMGFTFIMGLWAGEEFAKEE